VNKTSVISERFQARICSRLYSQPRRQPQSPVDAVDAQGLLKLCPHKTLVAEKSTRIVFVATAVSDLL